MKDEEEMPTEPCRVGVYHKMVMDDATHETTESAEEETQEERIEKD